MQIQSFEVFVVGNPPPSWGGRYWIFLKLISHDGIVGWGEAYGVPFHPKAVVAMLEDVCEREVVGHDPRCIESFWRKVYARNYGARPDSSLVPIISACEIAMWDMVGKALDQPVYALLGGKITDRLRAYTYLYPEPDDTADVYSDAAMAAQRAAEYVAKGFTAVKFDPLRNYSQYDPRQLSPEGLQICCEMAASIREAVGQKADLLIGTHGQMTPTAAIRLASALEPYQPLWLEEPVPPDHVQAMAQVARGSRIPVATGERLTTKYEFAQVMLHQAASILQMSLGRVGGLLEAKKIAGMAEAFHCQIAPHMYAGPIVSAADIQLSACSPNFLIQEHLLADGGWHRQIVEQPIECEQGYLRVPECPGIGVELNEAALRQHPYQDDALHLNPTTDRQPL